MNTDDGRFDLFEPSKKVALFDVRDGTIEEVDDDLKNEFKHKYKQIEVDELILLKGEMCKVVSFDERTVTLQLLSREEREMGGNRQERRAKMASLRRRERKARKM